MDLLVSSHTNQYQFYYTLEKLVPPGALGLNAFNHLQKFQLSYVFPAPALIPLVLSKFLAEHITSQFRLPILVHHVGWRLLGFHSSQHVGWHSSLMSHCKGSYQGCFDRLGNKGSAITAFNALTVVRCVLHREGLSSTVHQAVVEVIQAPTMKVYHQCWKEWADWCAQKGVPNHAISAPKLADILVHLFRAGLVRDTTGIYILLYQLFGTASSS